jgi:hypothetical protein
VSFFKTDAIGRSATPPNDSTEARNECAFRFRTIANGPDASKTDDGIVAPISQGRKERLAPRWNQCRYIADQILLAGRDGKTVYWSYCNPGHCILDNFVPVPRMHDDFTLSTLRLAPLKLKSGSDPRTPQHDPSEKTDTEERQVSQCGISILE